MPELLRPTVDFVFKRLFGDEKNADILVIDPTDESGDLRV